jgi:hypothetical protein
MGLGVPPYEGVPMLGFSIEMFRHDDYRKFDFPEVTDYCIASWTVGTKGLDWLDELVKEGKAKCGGNGYPLWYEAKAEVLLPVICAGPPSPKGPVVIGEDYVLPAGWIGKVKVNQSNVDRCNAEEELVIIAFDQS